MAVLSFCALITWIVSRLLTRENRVLLSTCLSLQSEQALADDAQVPCSVLGLFREPVEANTWAPRVEFLRPKKRVRTQDGVAAANASGPTPMDTSSGNASSGSSGNSASSSNA